MTSSLSLLYRYYLASVRETLEGSKFSLQPDVAIDYETALEE